MQTIHAKQPSEIFGMADTERLARQTLAKLYLSQHQIETALGWMREDGHHALIKYGQSYGLIDPKISSRPQESEEPAMLTPPNCADCAHVVDLGHASLCLAPQLQELIDSGNAGEPCQCARSFKAACGASGRWFVPLIGFHYSYVCECWKNNGQGCEAHVPHVNLPEHFNGDSQT